jgi:hypothetical protein
MKALKPLYTVLPVIFLFSVFISCKKQRIERKYTGDFLFTVHSHSWDISTGTHDTTFTFPGKIEISDESPHNPYDKDVYINIYYKSSTGYGTTAVDKHGKFSYAYCSGGFNSEDDLDFSFSGDGLSASFIDNVHGVRR